MCVDCSDENRVCGSEKKIINMKKRRNSSRLKLNANERLYVRSRISLRANKRMRREIGKSTTVAANGGQQQVIYLYFSDSIKQFDLLLLFSLSAPLAAGMLSFFFLRFSYEFYFYYASFQPQTFYYDHFHLFLVHLNVYVRR